MTQLQEKECLKGRFVHLHLHTLYSALDGAIKIKKLAEKLKANGMEACAITDHGVMYGIIDFYNTMKKEGIKPIIGSEFYISPPKHAERAITPFEYCLNVSLSIRGFL